MCIFEMSHVRSTKGTFKCIRVDHSKFFEGSNSSCWFFTFMNEKWAIVKVKEITVLRKYAKNIFKYYRITMERLFLCGASFSFSSLQEFEVDFASNHI